MFLVPRGPLDVLSVERPLLWLISDILPRQPTYQLFWAKGRLISEPRFPKGAPCETGHFSATRESLVYCFFKEKPSTEGRFPYLAWEKSVILQCG